VRYQTSLAQIAKGRILGGKGVDREGTCDRVSGKLNHSGPEKTLQGGEMAGFPAFFGKKETGTLFRIELKKIVSEWGTGATAD